MSKEDEDMIVKALKFEVSGSRERQKKTLKRPEETNKDNDHMKSGQLRRLEQYPIQHVMMMLSICNN